MPATHFPFDPPCNPTAGCGKIGRVGTTERTRVAVYERSIRASVARIWENVLDWEHLPWLHRTSFSDVRMLDASRAGWRAWVASRSRGASGSLGDVRLHPPPLRYLTRTLDGEAAGTEIWTHLEPETERATRIRVEFDAPGIAPELAAKVGDAYLRLYSRLWDEDEAMMMRRQAILDERGGRLPLEPRGGAGVPLGSLAELRNRLPLLVRVAGCELRLIELDGEIRAHPTVCPHRGGSLGEATIDDGCLTCPWHGYRYDLRSGRCVNGHRFRLGPLPQVRFDPASGDAALYW
jgi:nitrite reductase/ring-hydroxylating ferredoxin subunit